MDALALLLERRSSPRLILPAPQGEALENILAAGLRAPDHGGLTPWECVVAVGEGLDRLSGIFHRAAKEENLDEKALKKAQDAPYRAPMVIIVIAKVKHNKNVPLIEQIISAGCAVHGMQMAAMAQGFQGYWRTGLRAYHPSVRGAFNLEQDDEIVGFLYLGTPIKPPGPAPKRDIEKFMRYL